MGGKGKRSKRRRVNRLLGFSGTPTDAELDEVIDVWGRLMFRLVTSEQFLELVKNVQRMQGAIMRMSEMLHETTGAA